jgi:hypothetical protein
MEHPEPIKRRGHPRGRSWIAAVTAIAFVVAHGVMLGYVSSHMALSAAVVAGLILLILMKHVGSLASTYAMARRYFRRSGR